MAETRDEAIAAYMKKPNAWVSRDLVEVVVDLEDKASWELDTAPLVERLALVDEALAAERASRRRLAGHVCLLRTQRAYYKMHRDVIWELYITDGDVRLATNHAAAVDALAATKEELRLAHSTIRVGMEVIQRLLDDPDGEYERASARAWVREGEEYYARRDQPAASEGGE